MNYRLATLLAREAVSGDKTKVLEVNVEDSISQIQVIYESTGNGSGPPVALAAACVTKIELVDGSDVIYSLSGEEAQAVDFYHRKVEPPNLNVYLNAFQAQMVFNMNFGRYLWDPELAFDPRRFKNPQLKITIDVDAGGLGSSAGFLTVLANIFDEKSVSPAGFLMHKEIKNYSLGDGTHEYTSLPTDFPVRKLFIKSLVPGTGPEACFANIKLSEDNDKRIPFNSTIADILRMVVGQGPIYRETQECTLGGATGYIYHTPAYYPMINANNCVGSNVAYTLTVYGGEGGRGYIYAEGSVSNLQISIAGYCPHGVIEFPFGLQDDILDWYDVSRVGSLMLDIKSGASRSEGCQIFLQQHRSY